MAPIRLNQFPSEKSKIFWSNWVEKYKNSQDDGRWNDYNAQADLEQDQGGTKYDLNQITVDKSASIYDEVKRFVDENANSKGFKAVDSNGQEVGPPIDMRDIYPRWQSLDRLTTLQYTRQVIGQPPASGFPVYIAMHGGGGPGAPGPGKTYDDTFRDQDGRNGGEWSGMTNGYRKILESGVWIALRGVGNSWDMHFTRAGYVLVERLIENMALFGVKNNKDNSGPYHPIDTNRVYLIGFSAGGDGVYRLGMHLPQRFAAINMGAGHPGDVKFTNSLNLPTCLQVGEQDTSYGNRSKTAAESARTIDHLRLDARAWLNDAAAPVYINSCYIHPTAPDPASAGPDDDALYIHRHFGWESQYFNWSGDSTSPRPLSTIIKSRYAWLQAFDALAVRGGFLDIRTLTKEVTKEGTKEVIQDGKGPATAGIRETIQLNTNPIDWLNNKKFIRDPIPSNIIWDLYSDRIFGPNSSNDNFVPAAYNNTSGLFQWGSSKNFWGRKQFFWLDIGTTPPPSGILPIKVRLNTNENKIMIDQLPLQYLRILLRPEMLAQPSGPVTVVMPTGEVLPPVKPNWDHTDVIWDTMVRNDPNFIFNADVVVTQEGGKWTAASTPFPAPKL